MFRTTLIHRLPRVPGSLCTLAICAAALAVLVPSVAVSADYIVQKVDARKSRDLKNKVSPMLSNGFKQPSDAATFDEYYTKYVFAEWTNPNEYAMMEDSIRIPRRSLLQDLARARDKAVYDRLNDLALKQMIEFAKGNYHPATRYNAVLMIGQLNAERVEFPAMPVPLPTALSTLLSFAQDESLPDAVHAGALLGIVRHAEYGARDAESRGKIAGLMLSLATTQAPPRGRSKAGHAWFRRLAVDTLGRMGSSGQDGAVAKAIAAIVSEADAPLALRCEAAVALGRLKLKPGPGLEAAELNQAIEELFIDIAREEIRQGKEDATYVIDASLLKARLTAVHAALAGVKDKDRGILAMATKPEDKTAIQTLQGQIEKLLGKEHLDHDDLAPKTEKKKKPDEKTGPPGYGPGPEMPIPGPVGPAGPEGMGYGGQPGMGATGPVDPAKPVLDAIMAELVRLVKEYEAREGA